MLFEHPEHTGRRVRLAYCLNLHPAEDLDMLLEGMGQITLPLRDRLGRERELFGVGMYLSAALAKRLAAPEGKRELSTLTNFLVRNRLDPFTYNAFPAGGFHKSGLKEGVFKPTWLEEERVRFTLDVAMVASQIVRALGHPGSHISISTHSGAYGPWTRGDQDARRCAQNLGRVAKALMRLGLDTGPRYVLALEAEPRSVAGDSAALARFLERVPEWNETVVEPWVVSRGVGTCLDACHSAVEFEDPQTAFELAVQHAPLGKMQFSSALSIVDPATHPRAVEQLLAMDEPRYLHQITGLASTGRRAAADLPELVRELKGPARERWLSCQEWRCHFHVPVDLAALGKVGLTTTRHHADSILAAALAEPARWGVEELHLEIETYTWDVLPGPARGSGDQVEGLVREYEHVIGLLEWLGWRRDGDQPG